MAGIKETRELLELVESLAIAITKAKADGSIDWMDLPKLGAVVGAAKDAVEGAAMIPDELKDLDAQETQILLAEAINACMALGRAFLSK